VDFFPLYRGSGSTVENLGDGERILRWMLQTRRPNFFAIGGTMSEKQVVVDVEKKTPAVEVEARFLPLTLDQIGALPDFQQLTGKQANLVLYYLKARGEGLRENDARLRAVEEAYQLTGESARLATYSAFQNPRIEFCLDQIFDIPEHERIMRVLRRATRSCKTTNAQVKALRLEAEVSGVLKRGESQ
jgi:hypothetical protein